MRLQDDCDLDNPRERFVWALQSVGFNGFPIAMPEPLREEISLHLSRCGFVHDPAQQEIRYQPPVRGQDNALNQSGEWVPIDEYQDPGSGSLAELLSPSDKAKLIQEFREEGLLD